MKNFIYILTGAVGLFSRGAIAGKPSQIINCEGNNDNCNQHQFESHLHGTRDLRHLFGRGFPSIDSRAVAGKAAGKAAGTKPMDVGKAASGGIGKEISQNRPIYITEIVSMIKNNQRLPAAMQNQVAKKAKELGLQVPDPATQKATPAHLTDHPSSHALQKLETNDIPKEIMDAAQAMWGRGSTQTMNVGKSGVAVSQSQRAVVHRRDPYAETDYHDFYMYERDLEDGDFNLHDRDLEGDDFDLNERDLADHDFSFYERDIAPEWVDAY